MAAVNTIKKQLAQLGISSTPKGVRELVSNVRASPRGWTIPFDGRAVHGCLADQDADRAILRGHGRTLIVVVASRRNHNWQTPTAAWTRDDIDSQLDDLIEDQSDV